MIKKFLRFCVSLIGFFPFACTLPVLDTEYKTILYSPATFIFHGKLWIMGGYYRKTVSKTYNPRLFYGPPSWHDNNVGIRNDKVYSVSGENAILSKILEARYRFVFIDDKLHFEGKLKKSDVLRGDQYYIEHDGKIFVVGGKKDDFSFNEGTRAPGEDTVWSSADGLNWQIVMQNPPWAENNDRREHHKLALFNGQIYLARTHYTAGFTPLPVALWRSTDGKNWEKITEIANMKRLSSMFQFGNELFLLGNFSDGKQALFHSADGKEWRLIDSYPSLEDLVVVSRREKLFGFSSNNMYASDDGTQWTPVVNSPNVSSKVIAYNDRIAALDLFKDGPAYTENGLDWFNETHDRMFSFVPKDLLSETEYTYNSYSLVNFKDAIWVVGESPDRIYRSSDGITWTHVRVKGDKRFIPRSKFALAVFQNKLWIMGGVWVGKLRTVGTSPGDRNDKTYIVLNDVWSSNDGESWDLVTDRTAWRSRSDAAAIEFNNKLVLIGGGCYSGKKMDYELWQSSDGRAWNCTFSTGKGGKLNAEIREDFSKALVHNEKLYVFDIIAGELAVSADGRTFSKVTIDKVRSNGNIVSMNFGGKNSFVSKNDEKFFLSWDLVQWKDLQFLSSNPWQYSRSTLFSFSNKLYLADVDFNREAPLNSVHLKIDLENMTVAVEEK